MSSTCLGWCLLDGDAAEWGHVDLSGDIGARCTAAADAVAGLLGRHRPTHVVIESPVGRFAKAVIPQARVSGAVLSVLARRQALWSEVAPTVAKRVLAGDGSANKAQMVDAAMRRLMLVGVPSTCKGKAVCVNVLHGREMVILTEDEADAYALALCGAAMRVEVAA
jgi:Holliday junction resolvasome RuvABC endonuclease subunit